MPARRTKGCRHYGDARKSQEGGHPVTMETQAPSSTPPSSRQTVQVIQQAASRQPSTAAQYLQQMYAAQQQHLMLHTAALQQQNSGQSVTAAQQASPGVSGASPALNGSQTSQVTTIIPCPQTVSSAAKPTSGNSQQAVLLGNAPSPALSTTQAQMYLRAQMLIFTPAASVSSIQSDVSSPPPSSGSQVQPPVTRGGAQTPLLNQGMRSPSIQSVTPATQSKPVRSQRRGETPGSNSQSAPARTALTARAIITPGYSPRRAQEPVIHQLLLQPRQAPPQTRPVPPLTHQPQVSLGLSSPPVTSQAPLEPQEPEREKAGPTMVPPPQSPAPCGQDSTLQRRLLLSGSAVILQIPGAQQVAADRLQIPPAATPLSQPSQQQPATPNGPCDTEAHPPLDMTSGTGSSPLPAAATGSSPQNGENKPPQAVVRPQILTHVIEGFVIQEGAQPFPSLRSRSGQEARRSPLLAEKRQPGVLSEKLPQNNNAATVTTPTQPEREEPAVPESKADSEPPKLKCELCGRVNFEYKFKRSKRFCSMACAKRYNVGCSKRVGLFQTERSAKVPKPAAAGGGATPTRRRRSRKGGPTDDSIIQQVPGSASTATPSSQAPPLAPPPPPASSILKLPNGREDSNRCSDNSAYEEPISPASASSSLSCRAGRHHPGDFPPSDPAHWNVEDVYDFIRSLPGCREISEEFRAQEIDGQALLLLKEEHLMSAMNLKLGPALKLYAHISLLRDS